MLTEKRQQKIESVVSQRQRAIVVLEDIHDPHNAQAVIRTCDCFGVQTVYFIFENEKAFEPREIGKLTSSSANKWLDYKIFHSTEACYQELKKQGYVIFGTVISDTAESIFNTDFTLDKVAIAFGSEQRGLSQAAITNSDRLLTIPMIGMIQSLNLSVTAAITLFEVSRQRRLAGMENFSLSQAEQQALVESFSQR
jgi:tRNA (guanosine-2'-O-)-methyltransferase